MALISVAFIWRPKYYVMNRLGFDCVLEYFCKFYTCSILPVPFFIRPANVTIRIKCNYKYYYGP